MHSNRKWITAVAAVVVVAAIVAVASGAFSGHARGPVARPPSATHQPGPRPLRPVYHPPSEANSGISSSQQQADNAKIARAAAGNSAAWSAIEAMALPAPTPSAHFPAVPHPDRQNPDSYATAFVTELLNIDFATTHRPSLLSWAASETSPETMPGIPASAARKFLFADLTSSPSPVPTATAWTANAAVGVTWSASGVTTSVAPAWSQALAGGWQPPDLRMDFLDVTGNLTVAQPGRPATIEPFSLQLGLGTAEYHNGYGAMSVNNWTVG